MDLAVATRSRAVGYGGAPFAVLLLHAGGPAVAADVRAYLEQRLLDSAPFSVGFILRAPLTRWSLWSQARRLRRDFARLPAPLAFPAVLQRAAAAVEKRLRLRGRDATVRASTCYAIPGIERALVELHAQGLRRLILVMLHPQSSSTTTGGIHREFRRAVGQSGCLFRTGTVESWYADATYLDLMAQRLRRVLEDMEPEDRASAGVLFSAEAALETSRSEDPEHREQVDATVQGIVARLPSAVDWSVGHHGGPGPQRWLRPDCAEAAEILAERGCRHLLCMPLGVLEVLEMVVDLDVRLPVRATTMGFESIQRLPALGEDAAFLDLLAQRVEHQLTAE